MGSMALRAEIIVKGIVQGVGFRPFVFNLAKRLGLTGYVTNTSEGVLIDVEGARVSEFTERLRTEAPPLSRITDVTITPLPLIHYADFAIRASIDAGHGQPVALVSPDVSVCDDCLRELLDPADRRHLYPFINCTNCGPRYSITKSVPYDRPNTTMAGFTMCPACLKEYHDPADRRFHAQPNACPVCGPQVEFLGSAERGVRSAEYEAKGKEAIGKTIELLKHGGIVAVKGIGGFHIACDAANDDAVRRLRERKRKSNKPFAVMAPDMKNIECFCLVSDYERQTLLSCRRPIVLLQKRGDYPLSPYVSPGNQYLGCMLPYTPLHYLLLLPEGRQEPLFEALVMTSGNLSEEPIVRDNDEAVKKLSGLVDGFLLHDRDIFMRVDDSVIRVRSAPDKIIRGQAPCGVRNEQNSALCAPHSALSFLRRSRGYAPDPIMLRDDGPEVLGCGADLKNTFTLTKGKFAVVSQHIGDMENYETLTFYEECLENLKAVYRVEPQAIVHDLHPGYLSTRWALEEGARSSRLKLFGIQHHYAHIGSVMAEHGLTSKVIGIAFDGTGYGTDGNLWGGEFLIADIDGFERAGHLRYIRLPGGEAAIREPWKTAVGLVMQAGGEKTGELLEQAGFPKKYKREDIEMIMKIARSTELSPLSAGAGRLFEAVSALLGICDRNTFEGEAAMALESFTREGIEDEYPVDVASGNGAVIIDYAPTIIGIVADMARGLDKSSIATRFHNTVASVCRAMARRLSDQRQVNDVALSGGAFQNQYLLKRIMRLLTSDGMNVYTNQNVPCNDACISLGQAYLVRGRLKRV